MTSLALVVLVTFSALPLVRLAISNVNDPLKFKRLDVLIAVLMGIVELACVAVLWQNSDYHNRTVCAAVVVVAVLASIIEAVIRFCSDNVDTRVRRVIIAVVSVIVVLNIGALYYG